MTTSALILMLLVWGLTLGCTIYCFYKLLTSKRRFGGGDDQG
jgi:hypothetical protein